MNIFVVDSNPFVAAQSLCDAHVCKMIVESCQLLSTQDAAEGLSFGRYKPTHINHPCRKCLEKPANKDWLRMHLMGLLEEYTFRFHKIHKCQEMFECNWNDWSKWSFISADFPQYTGKQLLLFLVPVLNGFTDFPACMPDEIKNISRLCCFPGINSVVKAYRAYYRYKKRTLKRWKYTNREEPEWLEREEVG